MEIVGRRSSHYTRVVRIFAEELAVPCRFTPIHDLLSTDTGDFADNPALKLPILRNGDETYYGSRNICRTLWRHSGARKRVFWPEEAQSSLLMNAHELLAHAMSVQVEVVLHEIVEQRPPDTTSRKRRLSLESCIAWLDGRLDAIVEQFPGRDLSLFEVELFCLLTHFPFRNPMDLDDRPALRSFEQEFGQRPSARNTPYEFDPAPSRDGNG